MFKRMNPIKWIALWLLSLLIIGIVGIPLLFTTTVGGEQKPLSLFVYLFLAAVWGTFILSVVTPFFYSKWFKKYWFMNLLIFLISGYYSAKDQIRKANISYGFKETFDTVNNDEIKTTREYYSFEPEKIRSESFWRNGRKDSIWTVYEEDGRIINQWKFKDGNLIETLK